MTSIFNFLSKYFFCFINQRILIVMTWLSDTLSLMKQKKQLDNSLDSNLQKQFNFNILCCLYQDFVIFLTDVQGMHCIARTRSI